MTLRSLAVGDAAQMLKILTNNLVKMTYMLPDFDKEEDALPLFQRLAELSCREDRFVRGIFQGDMLVGFLNDVEIQNGTIELGYVVHPDYWGRGYATEALTEAISALFDKGYREVICGAFSENAASIRVMEKAGMKRLPKTEDIEYRGRTHFCVYYGIQNGGTHESQTE